MKTLSIVIPSYNEEARLPALLRTLADSADAAVRSAGFELLEALIVDDGSDDQTRMILSSAELAKLRPVLDGSGHRGKGAAVASGVRLARGDYVLLADADLSTPLEELHKLSAAIGAGADLAIGSRAMEGAVVQRGPAHRKLTGRGFSRLVRAITGLRINDTQNGFKLIPGDAARELFSEQLCPGFAFDVEILMRAQLGGMQIAEVPVLYVHDSRSRVRVISASLEMLREVTMAARKLRSRGRGDDSRRRAS